jgi:hypothetical protein
MPSPTASAAPLRKRLPDMTALEQINKLKPKENRRHCEARRPAAIHAAMPQTFAAMPKTFRHCERSAAIHKPYRLPRRFAPRNDDRFDRAS